MLKKIRWIAITLACLLGVLCLILPYFDFVVGFCEPAEMKAGEVMVVMPVPRIDPEAAAREFLESHQGEISACEEKDLADVKTAVSDLNRFFDAKQEQVAVLVDRLFTLTSKGKMVYYLVMGNGRIERYLEQEFMTCIGGPEDLKREIQVISSAMKRELTENHNRLALAIEADLQRLPFELGLHTQSASRFASDFRQYFDHTIRGMLPRTVGVQLGIELICLAVDIWLAPVIAAILVDAVTTTAMVAAGGMATEIAVISIGAASSPYTFGVSLIVGTIIAVIIDWAGNKIAEADATEKIGAAIEAWRQGTVTAFEESVRTGLSEFHDARQRSLRKVLFQEINSLTETNR